MAHLDIQEAEKNVVPVMDVVEQVVLAQGWRCSRSRDDEMAAEFKGKWCDYTLHFAFAPDLEAMHLSCAFDIRIPERKRAEVYELLALVNDSMWLGHFGVWESEGLPMFRHALPLRGAPGLAPEQVEDLLDVTISECERFYPAFQFLIWGGKKPSEALDAAIIETVGEA